MGLGWTFDDLEESTLITRRFIEFFHMFVEFGSNILYLRDCESEYREQGFQDALAGSTENATHIPIEKVSYNLRQAYLEFQAASTSCAFNLTVNHHCKILHSTTFHPTGRGGTANKPHVCFIGLMHQLCKCYLNSISSSEFNLES